MDSQRLYEQLALIGQQTQSIEQSIQEMQETIYQLVEENTSLKIENRHLREKLESIDPSGGTAQKKIGISNLEKLYDSGVHICHNFYGAQREGICLLCESLLRHLEE